jgi:hypothetical protein
LSVIRKILLCGALILVALAAGFAAWLKLDSDPRLRIGDHQNYTRGQYLAFAVPWGAQGGSMRLWSKHADTLWIDTARFPSNTAIRFVWPPWAPTGGIAGVWGYMGVVHGNYDGGAAEVPVEPRRVDDIRALSQDYAWSGDFGIGVADVLTEFYLRRDPADNESKTIEIGWFLHAPAQTRYHVEQGQQLGRFVDAAGQRWQVARNDRFVTFMREGGVDSRAGRIDMLAALRWLKAKGQITGREWYSGVAWGVEPFRGTARVQLDRWAVTYR